MLQSQGESTMVSARDFRTAPFSATPSARLAPSIRSALRPCAATCVYSHTVASRFVFRHCEANLSASCCVVCARRSDQRGGNRSW
eukprot:1173568-Prymnesium_polylepis.1